MQTSDKQVYSGYIVYYERCDKGWYIYIYTIVKIGSQWEYDGTLTPLNIILSNCLSNIKT